MSIPLRHARAFILLPAVLALALVAAVAFLLNRAGGMNMQIAASGLQAEAARYAAEAGLAQLAAQTQGRNCTGYTDLPATTFGAGSFSATVNPKAGSSLTLVSTATLADGATSTLTRSNVVMYQTTPYTLSLQPDASGLDTYIRSSNPTTNYGADTSLRVDSGQAVALVRFDLSSVPANSDIRSAQFSLYHLTGSNDTVSAIGVTKPWTEGTGALASGATWSTYDGVHAWATAGGDYDPAAGVAITLPGNSQWATWELAAWAAAWNAGIQPNYGIALVGTGGSNNTFVSSDESTNVTLRPKLTVTFLPPCGWTPPSVLTTLPASQDTWIDESGSGKANYGGSPTITVTSAGRIGRGLVRFDLSTLPPGTVLANATLRLYVGSVSNPSDSSLSLHRVVDPWVEGTKTGSGTADGATWIKRDPINDLSWNSGSGGSFAATTTPPVSISSAFTSGWVEWNVTALAQQWLDGVYANYGAGVMIDTSAAVVFNSRQETANQPQLVLTY